MSIDHPGHHGGLASCLFHTNCLTNRRWPEVMLSWICFHSYLNNDFCFQTILGFTCNICISSKLLILSKEVCPVLYKEFGLEYRTELKVAEKITEGKEAHHSRLPSLVAIKTQFVKYFAAWGGVLY